MSVALILRNLTKLIVLVGCILAMPLMGQQQPGTQLSLQVEPQSGSATQPASGAAVPNAPTPKKMPLPLGLDYSNPARHFPNPIAPYTPRSVELPGLLNTTGLEGMIQSGKLKLSLNDAISFALTDNLDIAIARYNLPIADTDLLRTKAGAGFLGVNSGVIQNTQGGGGIAATLSGGAGGTTAGAGGVGGGAGGVTGNTLGAGSNIDSFDPILTGTFQVDHAISPSTNTIITGGAGTTIANTTIGNFTYNQGFAPGTLLTVTYRNQRQTQNFLTLSPQLQSSFNAQVRQHLLQGFGLATNRRFITIAKNDKRITEEAFRQQVMSTVSQIQNIYWDLVSAYEDVQVKERALALARKTLSDNRKQVEIGTLPPISIVEAQKTVAQDEQALLTAKTTLDLEQLFMKSALTRKLTNDSTLGQAEIIPTDNVQIPEKESSFDVDALVKQALASRPDYLQQLIQMKSRELSLKTVNNALLPTVDVFAYYGASSLAGDPSPVSPSICGNPGSVVGRCSPPFAPTGFGDTFSNLFNSSGPDKGVGFQINIPIRNRAAQALQVRSQLEYRQVQLSIRQFENNVAIRIRNDTFVLQQLRASVLSARDALAFARQTLDAEQKKYNLGASTFLNVLTDQSLLAQAEENVVSAEILYAKAQVTLDFDTAQTLERNNIMLDEAVTGQIKTPPNVPGIAHNALSDQPTPAPTKPQKQ